MTPELQQSIANRARALQSRMRPDKLDAVLLATEARRLFEDAARSRRCCACTPEIP